MSEAGKGEKRKREGEANGKEEAKKDKVLAVPTGLKALSRLKVVYFHDPELSVFEHGRESRFRPFRAKLAHSLICSYGYYPSCMEPLRPRLVTRTDLGQFHSDAYLEILATAQRTVNSRHSWKSAEVAPDEPVVDAKVEELFGRFNVFLDPRRSPNAVFPGIMDYCRLYTTGSMGCAARLCSGEANLAINWYGGHSHARSSSAQHGCYVNDTVLAILELLQVFKRVLYINLSGVHCDAVEQAFYSTQRVLTVSFHLKPSADEPCFPGTGDVADTGVHEGDGFSVNVPLEPGLCDGSFLPLFRSIVTKAKAVYAPDAVVLQLGAGLLAGERNGNFNLTSKGYGDCARIVRDIGLPLLLLGGIGHNLADTARLWAYLTSVVLGLEASLPNVVPQSDYRDYFGPDFATSVASRYLPENMLSSKSIANLRRKVMNSLDRLKQKAAFS